MAHTLYLGMTESGKTTLAKIMAAEYKKQGVGILVLDPLKDPGWNADFITSDPNEFLRVFFESRSCMVFIDEAGENVGRYDTALVRTATKGRHWGHSVNYLTQRASLISLTVRDQCRDLYLFSSGFKDCKMLENEFNSEELLQAPGLGVGEFMQTSKHGPTTRYKINFSNMQIERAE
jgi:hypothetical protein